MLKDKRRTREAQEKSSELERQWVKLLWPVLTNLNKKLDRRLVSTFLGLVMAIILHRHRNHGLLLSELGGDLLGAEQCRAGTKRISNLIHSQKWNEGAIEDFFWQEGTRRVDELWAQGERPLVIWDESVLEKPESLKAEGLCAVRSSKAVRLKRIKPGFFNPAGGRPVFVPGFHWLKILVVGRKGNPTLVHMGWWTTPGEQSSQKRTQESLVLAHIDQLWGKQVLHIWDRGFAGNPWLTQAFLHGARFVLRWMNRNNCANPGRSAKASLPGNIGSYGMRVGVVIARLASSLSRSQILLITNRSGLLLQGAKDNLPGICSPANRPTPRNSPGRLSWLMLAAGKSKWPSATTNVNWPLRAQECSSGSIVLNYC